jgi:hypothetical protein
LKDSRTRKYGIAVVCIVVALAVGLSVGLTRNAVDEQPVVIEVPITDSPTMMPSAAPTSVPFASATDVITSGFEGLIDNIGSLLKDANSPQAQALDWILNVDTFFNFTEGQLLQNVDEARLL